MRIRHRLMTSFALLVIAMMSAVVLAEWTLTRNQERLSELHAPALHAPALFLTQLMRAEITSAIQEGYSYPVSHDPVEKQEFWEHIRKFDANLEEFRTVARWYDAPADAGERRYDPIKAVRNDLVHQTEEIFTTVDAGRALGKEFIHEYDDYVDGTTALLDSFIEYERQEVEAAQRDALAALHRYRNFTVGIGLLSVVLAILLAAYLSRVFTTPLEQLQRAAGAIAHGDFDAMIAVQAKDEIGELASTLRSMKYNVTRLFDDLNTEITQRRDVESRLKAILDNTVSVIFLKDIQGRYLLINHQFENLFHVTNKEVVGKTDYEIFPKEIADIFRSNDRKVLAAGRPLEMEEVAPQDDGPHTYIAVKFPVFDADGRAYAVGGVATDITARARAEEALREIAHYDAIHGKALTLFNSSYDRDKILTGVLSLLAEDQHLPVSAIYAFEEWPERLRLAATWGAAPGLAQEFQPGEGLIGQAAQANKTIVLDNLEDHGFKVEAGLLSLHPAALLITPINHQGKRLGVMVLGSSRTFTDRDRTFIERLCVQLGAALNNLKQYENLKMLTEQLRQRGEGRRMA